MWLREGVSFLREFLAMSAIPIPTLNSIVTVDKKVGYAVGVL